MTTHVKPSLFLFLIPPCSFLAKLSLSASRISSQFRYKAVYILTGTTYVFIQGWQKWPGSLPKALLITRISCYHSFSVLLVKQFEPIHPWTYLSSFPLSSLGCKGPPCCHHVIAGMNQRRDACTAGVGCHGGEGVWPFCLCSFLVPSVFFITTLNVPLPS